LPNNTAPASSVPSGCFSVGTKTCAPGSISPCSEGNSPTIGIFEGIVIFLRRPCRLRLRFPRPLFGPFEQWSRWSSCFSAQGPKDSSAKPRRVSGKTTTSTARSDPSGCGSVAVSINVPSLISSIDDFTTASAAYLSFRLTVTSLPSLVCTTSFEPSRHAL
jgi:hypothetical protein